MSDVYRIEFTIEPFVEGRPGPHVTGPVDAIESMGIAVDVGPFGSSCLVEPTRVPDVSERIVRAALEGGATHVNVDVSEESP